MNVGSINAALAVGNIELPGLFPHLDRLSEMKFIFRVDFGLPELPQKPGFLSIRGPRQYGKSTWLEEQLKATVRKFGPGSAFYVNGDELSSVEALALTIRNLLPAYRKDATVRRLFIDELTTIPHWERGIKRLIDGGELRKVLVVSTGSKATDLRRGTERLPGRKGELTRTEFIFLPIPFQEFLRVSGDTLGSRTLSAYLISGGSPLACAHLTAHGIIPEFIVESTRDWILGEAAAGRRDRASVLAVMEVIHRYGGNPLGQTKLARESGLANNTVAAGYVELLSDLLCVAPAFAYDPSRGIAVRRKPYKLHFINLLSAVAWSPDRVRTPEDFERLRSEEQGKWFEWLVAQELFRRQAREGQALSKDLLYWQSATHEIDFVLSRDRFLEVKRGEVKPLNLSWFAHIFPKGRLTVVNPHRFATDAVRGIPIQEWLLESIDTLALTS